MKLKKPKPFPEFGTYCEFLNRRIRKEYNNTEIRFIDGNGITVGIYEGEFQTLAVNEKIIINYDTPYTRETTLELIKDSISETFNLTIVEAY